MEEGRALGAKDFFIADINVELQFEAGSEDIFWGLTVSIGVVFIGLNAEEVAKTSSRVGKYAGFNNCRILIVQ